MIAAGLKMKTGEEINKRRVAESQNLEIGWINTNPNGSSFAHCNSGLIALGVLHEE